MSNILSVAQYLRDSIESMEIVTVYSPREVGVPLVAFGLTQPGKR